MAPLAFVVCFSCTSQRRPLGGPARVLLILMAAGWLWPAQRLPAQARFQDLRENTTPDDFGRAIAVIGDITGDGVVEFAVGAPRAGPNNQGVVYVYTWNAGSQQYALLRSIPAQTQGQIEFGYSISPAGDLNGDGIPAFVVGAPGDSNGGSVYAINGASVAGGPPQRLWSSSPSTPGARFGFSVSAVGRAAAGPADLINDVVVGAPEALVGQGNAGRVYVLDGTSGTVLLDRPVGNANWWSQFGWAVSWTGDYDGDYFNDFLVSDPKSSNANFIYFDLGPYPPGTRLYFQAGFVVAPNTLRTSDVALRDVW